ncbi:MAG: ATP-binding cassette domain-containing protein [Schleiferiaceae bacterium]
MTGLLWNGVGKQISGSEIIRPWSATFTPQARVAILGVNGSGKSTVIALLSGQLPPSVGSLSSPFIQNDLWATKVSWA